ncbi:MAG: MarR family transcriptional regulator [Deltaproteobacteria bacterium]|nr:MarR family transcriptional regulator [Deltaproteobacteria bacterium]
MPSNQITPPVQDRVGFLINNASWVIRGHMLKFIRSLGVDLTPEQWLVLNWLWSHSGVCQQDLVEVTQKSKANITRMIDSLMKRDYVIRVSDVNDRRKHLLEMTPTAIEMMGRIMPHVFLEYQKIIQDLSKDEIRLLKTVLGKIVAQVRILDGSLQ